MEITDIISFIKDNLSLDIISDLKGNQHLCLLLGDTVISNVMLPENESV